MHRVQISTRPRPGGQSLEKKQGKYTYVFLLPYIIGSAVFILYPVVLSIIFSVSKILPNTIGYDIELSGFNQYQYLFRSDPHFLRTLWNTIQSMLINVPVVLVFSFFVASMLNQKFFGRTVARAILFMPIVVSSAVVKRLISSNVLDEAQNAKRTAEAVAGTDYASAFISSLGDMLDPSIVNLLQSSINNIGNILAMSAIPIIIFLSGLQSISPSIYEASYVEGATKWEVFWKISLPMISPLVLVVVVYAVVDSFTSYENQIMRLVRETCFEKYDFSLGSAMIWIYLLIVMAILIVTYVVVNRFVFYYDD